MHEGHRLHRVGPDSSGIDPINVNIAIRLFFAHSVRPALSLTLRRSNRQEEALKSVGASLLGESELWREWYEVHG